MGLQVASTEKSSKKMKRSLVPSRRGVRLPSDAQLPVQIRSNAKVVDCPILIIPVLPSQLSRFGPRAASVTLEQALGVTANRLATKEETDHETHHMTMIRARSCFFKGIAAKLRGIRVFHRREEDRGVPSPP